MLAVILNGLRAPAMLLAAALLLAACGGDGDDGGSAATPPPDGGAGTATAEATAAPSTPTPPPYPTAPALPGVTTARITTDNLNVRVGPGTSSPAIGLLQPDAEVQVAGRTADGQWLAIANTGWIVYRSEWVALPVDVSTLPEVDARGLVPPVHPPGTSSGYPAVDIVIDAALEGDVDRLVALAETLSLPCEAEAAGPGGGPPCNLRPGTTPGTALEVFPTAACEGEHILVERLRDALQRLYVSSKPEVNAPLRLYAVVEAPAEQSPMFPEGRWVAIFQQPDGSGRALGISERGIVRADLGCGHMATDMLQRRPFVEPRWVLLPVLTPPVEPRP